MNRVFEAKGNKVSPVKSYTDEDGFVNRLAPDSKVSGADKTVVETTPTELEDGSFDLSLPAIKSSSSLDRGVGSEPVSPPLAAATESQTVVEAKPSGAQIVDKAGVSVDISWKDDPAGFVDRVNKDLAARAAAPKPEKSVGQDIGTKEDQAGATQTTPNRLTAEEEDFVRRATENAAGVDAILNPDESATAKSGIVMTAPNSKSQIVMTAPEESQSRFIAIVTPEELRDVVLENADSPLSLAIQLATIENPRELGRDLEIGGISFLDFMNVLIDNVPEKQELLASSLSNRFNGKPIQADRDLIGYWNSLSEAEKSSEEGSAILEALDFRSGRR